MVGGTDVWRSAKPVAAPLENMKIYEMQLKTDARNLTEQKISDLF
jgi:hypothetical protein